MQFGVVHTCPVRRVEKPCLSISPPREAPASWNPGIRSVASRSEDCTDSPQKPCSEWPAKGVSWHGFIRDAVHVAERDATLPILRRPGLSWGRSKDRAQQRDGRGGEEGRRKPACTLDACLLTAPSVAFWRPPLLDRTPQSDTRRARGWQIARPRFGRVSAMGTRALLRFQGSGLLELVATAVVRMPARVCMRRHQWGSSHRREMSVRAPVSMDFGLGSIRFGWSRQNLGL